MLIIIKSSFHSFLSSYGSGVALGMETPVSR